MILRRQWAFATIGLAAGFSGAAVIKLLSGDCCATATIGTEIRLLDARSNAELRGTITAIDRDSFTVALATANPLRVSLRDTAGMRVNAGTESRWAEGWARGLLIGGGAGAVIGLASGNDPPGFLSFTAPEKALVLGIAGGVFGSTLGALIGAASRSERWQRVNQLGNSTANSNSIASSVFLAPSRGKGAAVGLRLRF